MRGMGTIKARSMLNSLKEKNYMLDLIILVARVSVPDSGTTLSLLAIALGGLTFLRSKLK